MSKYFILSYFIFYLISCKQKKKCDLIYQDSIDIYCASGEIRNGLENGRFVFTQEENNDSFQEAGFYLDGVRNDLWVYRIKDELSKVKWANYEDKNLNFKTNLFSEIDSIKRGSYFTKFQINSAQGKLILTVSINGSMKDSFPEKNYNVIIKNEFSQLGYDVLECSKKIISDRMNKIYVNDVVVKSKNTPKESFVYLKNAFGWIRSDFVDFTVSYTTKDNSRAHILFEGILTNFYLNKQRLFNPFEYRSGEFRK